MQASNIHSGYITLAFACVLLAFCSRFARVGSRWVKTRDKVQNMSETTHSVIRPKGVTLIRAVSGLCPGRVCR